MAGAISWFEKQGKRFCGDASHLFAVAHSAGAYNLYLAILSPKYLKEAGADPSMIRGVATLARPFDFLPVDTRPPSIQLDRNPTSRQPNCLPMPALQHPAFLLQTGADDMMVYPKNGWSLDRILREKGGSSEFIEHKVISHIGILKPLARPFRSAALAVMEDILGFHARHGGT